MKLTKSQLEVLHILWSSDKPQSIQEIVQRSKYRFIGNIIVSFIVKTLQEKEVIYQAGAFHSYTGDKETVVIVYSSKICFDEYYNEKFRNIAPINIFCLQKKLLYSDNLSLHMLHDLEKVLTEIIEEKQSEGIDFD